MATNLSYHDIKTRLTVHSPDSNAAFSTMAALSRYVTSVEGTDNEALSRDLVIRALDVRESLKAFDEVIDALVRQVGLFPYLPSRPSSATDELALEFHRPASLRDEGIVFHRVQTAVYQELMSGRSIVLSAPTSFGKSLIIDAVVASQRFENIVIVVPTLALIDETRRRLSRFQNYYKIITHGQQSPSARNIFIHTQERAVENKRIGKIDFLVVDEFYKLSPDEDSERSMLLNTAFYSLAKRSKQFYLLGPSVQNIPEGFDQNYNCTFIRTDFSTVASETRHVPGKGRDFERLVALCETLTESTLVFCASPGRARLAAGALLDSKQQFTASPEATAAATWLGEAVHPSWQVVRALHNGIGIHHGRLPRSLGQLIVRLFNEGGLRFLVCTSTLIEGVNTAAKNVVIFDNKIAKEKYDYFTFNNIRGRSGRMLKHFTGNVYLFHAPPEQELPLVDVPVFTQGTDAPDSLLLQIHDEDLSDRSRKRLGPVLAQRLLPIDLLRQNVGVDPNDQLGLAHELQLNYAKHHSMIAWSGIPSYRQIYATSALVWDHLVHQTGRVAGVSSARQLGYLLIQLMQQPVLKLRIQMATASLHDPKKIDETIDEIMDFSRQWAMYKVPRLFGALDRIQSEVFSRMRLTTGSYGYFLAQLENLFLPPALMALEEYGIPIQLGAKLWSAIGAPETLDDALTAIRNGRGELATLSAFELRMLRDAKLVM